MANIKYLFFDIECANCFNGIGKMCEFGYVVTDEKFTVIKSGDIPMSPGKGRNNRFHLKGRKHERDLELAYEYSYYLEQHEFPYFYKKIKELMEDPDTICFAYSMYNDIAHLYNSCKRYKLEPLNYTCYDVQKLACLYLEQKKQVPLHTACREIVGPNSTIQLQEHLSRDDAMMEKMVFEAVCALKNKTPVEIMEDPEFTKANSIEYMKTIEERSEKKKQKVEGHELYNSITTDISLLDNPEYVGRRYNVSGEVKSDPEILRCVINLVTRINGVFTHSLDKADYFIALDNDNRNDLIQHFKRPYGGQILTYQELLNKIQSK